MTQPANGFRRAVPGSEPWEFEHYLLAAVGGLIVLFFAVLAWALPWHNLACWRGHYETAVVAGHVEYRPGNVDGRVALIPVHVPEQEVRVWVCDESRP